MADVPDLARVCQAANRQAWRLFGVRNTCITTSAAVCDVLTRLGMHAELLRVEAAVFTDQSPVGTILGAIGDGTFRPAAGSGNWHGHLVAVAENRWLIDPTLDQVKGVKPFVGEVTGEFLQGQQAIWWVNGQRHTGPPSWTEGVQTVRYKRFPRQTGWKSSGAFRVSQRKLLVLAIMIDLAETC